MTNVYLKFDKDIGALRRSLRADAYNVILIGFVGTLVGMISSFASLMLSLGNKDANPMMAINNLISGGMSTALVSSLIASVLAGIVIWYLSYTEKGYATLKLEINAYCNNRYREESMDRFVELDKDTEVDDDIQLDE